MIVSSIICLYDDWWWWMMCHPMYQIQRLLWTAPRHSSCYEHWLLFTLCAVVYTGPVLRDLSYHQSSFIIMSSYAAAAAVHGSGQWNRNGRSSSRLICWWHCYFSVDIFTARCTIVHSAVLPWHVACLSTNVCDVGRSGWKSWKLIARTLSPTPSLFGAQMSSTYSQGNIWEILGRLEVGWGKMALWSTKAAICLKRVQIEEKLLWGAYRNSPTLFPTAPTPTPYGLHFPKIGVRTPPKTPITIISGMGKATKFKFCTHIYRLSRNKSPLTISRKVAVGV